MVLSEMEAVLLAGIFTEAVSALGALLLATTGIPAAASRYAVVLAGANEVGAERATAIGFFSGLGFGGLVLLLEALT